MRDDNDPRLLQQFERGGRLRADALGAADELAGALAEAKGGLTIGDLRPGFEALRKAQASEDRLARTPVQKGLRLQPAPLPIPRPFIAPAARVVSHNPELTRELDRLPADDAAKIRAQLADLDRGNKEQKREEAPAPAADNAPVPAPEEKEAEAPSTTLTIANDA